MKTIMVEHCFAEASFSLEQETESKSDPDDDVPLTELVTRTADTLHLVEPMTCEEYETADRDVPGSEQ